MNQPRITYLSTYSPSDVALGGAASVDQRLVTVLNAAGYSVSLFPVCTESRTSVPLELSLTQMARVLSRMVRQGEPYQKAKFQAFRRPWRTRIQQLRESADEIIVASGWPALLLAVDAGLRPDVYVALNQEHVIADAYSPWILRALSDPDRLRRIEIQLLKTQPRQIACLSATDCDALTQLTGRKCHYLPLPLFPEAECESPKRAPYPLIGFLGKATWPPNAEAIEFLLDHIVPSVRLQLPDVRVWLAGRGSEQYARHPQVIQTGEVTSTDDFWQEIDIQIIPRLLATTGVSIKAIEGSEWGVPTLVSPGIAEAIPGSPWPTATDASEFSRKAVELLSIAGTTERRNVRNWASAESSRQSTAQTLLGLLELQR